MAVQSLTSCTPNANVAVISNLHTSFPGNLSPFPVIEELTHTAVCSYGTATRRGSATLHGKGSSCASIANHGASLTDLTAHALGQRQRLHHRDKFPLDHSHCNKLRWRVCHSGFTVAFLASLKYCSLTTVAICPVHPRGAQRKKGRLLSFCAVHCGVRPQLGINNTQVVDLGRLQRLLFSHAYFVFSPLRQTCWVAAGVQKLIR